MWIDGAQHKDLANLVLTRGLVSFSVDDGSDRMLASLSPLLLPQDTMSD